MADDRASVTEGCPFKLEIKWESSVVTAFWNAHQASTNVGGIRHCGHVTQKKTRAKALKQHNTSHSSKTCQTVYSSLHNNARHFRDAHRRRLSNAGAEEEELRCFVWWTRLPGPSGVHPAARPKEGRQNRDRSHLPVRCSGQIQPQRFVKSLFTVNMKNTGNKQGWRRKNPGSITTMYNAK